MSVRRCLFPISVDRRQFRTEPFVSAIKAIAKPYDECVFLIADWLQLHNKASLCFRGLKLSAILDSFRLRNPYLGKRKQWLRRVCQRVQGTWAYNASWVVIGMDDIMDKAFCRTWRNVVLMYECIDEFRDEIHMAASEHNVTAKGSADETSHLRLSNVYLLEQVAVSVRLRVIDSIEAEYYIGDTLPVLVKLYAGRYGVNVWTLAGSPTRRKRFRVFRLKGRSGSLKWAPL